MVAPIFRLRVLKARGRADVERRAQPNVGAGLAHMFYSPQRIQLFCRLTFCFGTGVSTVSRRHVLARHFQPFYLCDDFSPFLKRVNYATQNLN